MEHRQASIGAANCLLSPAERSVLDPTRQIRLFAKLKLADCVSIVIAGFVPGRLVGRNRFIAPLGELVAQ